MHFFDGPSESLDGPPEGSPPDSFKHALSQADASSFPDAEASKDLSKQILAGHLPGDLAQRPLSEPEVLGEKLERPRARRCLGGALDERA